MMTNSLNRTLTLEINGKSRDLFMSFGLLNELASLLGDVDRLTELPINHELRTVILKAVLSERTKAGKIVTEADLSEIDMDPQDVPKILAWVGEWVVDFFIQSGEAVKSVFVANMERVKSLTSSPNGTAA
ncbi:hypothetical protein D3877_23400 [Azospirillum cavernae]|jgi:hypothetical protein|uniref:Uncharacterized protein n=1 Tax=Azospirillum cavernae TaxID=2320860 RepID=A0A418VPF0_9PROT|nr:hypothetical protein [Azospirillum cavernae]RJF78079.1 hypothetical protein D3877_23400 [Azospirillum cavernae]